MLKKIKYLNDNHSYIVTGPNGSGKSIFIESIVHEAIAENMKFSYMPQKSRLCWNLAEWVRINQKIGTKMIPVEEQEILINLFKANNYCNSNVSKMSDGQMAVVQFLSNIFIKARIFILDELTNGMDGTNKRVTISIIKKMVGQGCKFIVCTHDHDLKSLNNFNEIEIKGDKNENF